MKSCMMELETENHRFVRLRSHYTSVTAAEAEHALQKQCSTESAWRSSPESFSTFVKSSLKSDVN